LTRINLVAAHTSSGMHAVACPTSNEIIHRPLDQSIRSKHDAPCSRYVAGYRRIPMIERVLPLSHQEIPHRQLHAARQARAANPFSYGLAARAMRLLRAVGAFFAAGGALS